MDFTLSPVFLILWYVMPGDLPDKRTHPMPEASMEECIKDAMEFRKHGVPDKVLDEGATGIAFTCLEKADKRT